MAISSSIISFMAILMVIFISPFISHRVKLPVMVIEVIIGIILGQSLLNVIKEDPWLDFFSFFGLIYLLFLAGLEIEFHKYARIFKPIILVASASLLLPFVIGYQLGKTLLINPFFLGTLLSTTSIGVVIPLARELKGSQRFTSILLGSTMLVDVVSMFLLTASAEAAISVENLKTLWPYILFLAFLLIPFGIRRFKIGKALESWSADKTHFQFEVRACFALIAVFVLLSEFIGIHAILGAFIAGLIVSEFTHKGGKLEGKLLGFGYGFFTPFFFTIVGATTDLPSLLGSSLNLPFLALIIVLGILSKVTGVTLTGILIKLKKRESLSMGFIESSRLSLILAGATIGRNLNLIDSGIFSSLVVFAIITVIVGPTLGTVIMKRKIKPIQYYPEIPEEFWKP